MTVKQVKQDYKEHLFSIDAHTQDAQAESPLFSVVRQTPEQLIIKLSPDTTNNQVLSHFIGQGVEVRAFNEILPSLNDIFIRIVEGTPAARQFEKLA